MDTPTTPPSLGYGQRGAASIDSVNQWLRAQPDYQALIRSFGQDPNNVHLNDAQKTAVVRLAQSKGVVVDEGGNGQEVDDSGNFRATSHNLRNGLMVAGIAGAALLTAGAAGLFGGAAAAGGEAGASGAAAALGPSTAANMAATAGIAGGAGVPSSIAAAGGAAGAGGSLWSQIAKNALPIGSAIGKAASAAGQNRVNQEGDALQANRDNVVGNQAYENQLMARAKQDASERHNALIDVARASDERNPNISPFNTRGPKTYSPEYLSTLTALEQAGVKRLATDPTNSMNTVPPLRPYKPLDITDVQGATGTRPSIWEQIGNYAAPALTTYGALRS